MHLGGHALSALPLLAAGYPWAALGAVAPDLAWALNEYRYRRSEVRPWSRWILSLPERCIVPYRAVHALWVPLLLALLSADLRQFAAGWLLHLLIDLPTHSGRMSQMPLYPFSRWQWKWSFIK